MNASRVERGTTMQGEYVLLECIGDINGLVFRAERKRDGAVVTVRVFADLDGEQRERLLAHASRASRLRHPVLAAVSAFGVNGDDIYVVEDYVEGRSIAELTERSGIPPLTRAVEITLQLCRGLESAHRHGVAHDALGPCNVVLRGGAGEASPLQVRLLDLSTPSFVRPWPPALSRALYMAPEQLAELRIGRNNAQGATPAMNLYSIAALLYDLCTGGPPIAASSLDELADAHAAERIMPPSRINPQIPSTLDAVLLRALSPDPARRYASVAELIEALSGLRLSTSVSGVQPVAVLPRSSSVPAAEPERATWHGGFNERPTSKTELPASYSLGATPLRPPAPATQDAAPTLPRPPQLPRPPAAEVRPRPSSAPPPERRSSAPSPEQRSSPPSLVQRSSTPSLVQRSSAPSLVQRSSAPPLEQGSSAPPLERRVSVPLPSARRSLSPLLAPELAQATLASEDRPAFPPAQSPPPASTPPALAQRSSPPRGAFSAVTPTTVPTPTDPRRSRPLWLGWSVAGCVAVAAFWYALSLQLPQEEVHATPLAAVPEPARAPELRVRPQPAPVAPPADPPAATSSDSRASGPSLAERFEPASASASAREPQRSARGVEVRPRSTLRATDSRALGEAQAVARSSSPSTSSTRLDAQIALPDGVATVDEPTRSVLEPEPENAHPRVAAEQPTAVPADPPAAQGHGARVAAAQPPAPEPHRPAMPASALRTRISALAVRGSLPSSQVAQGIERVVPQLNECYRKAAATAGQALPPRVQIALELDEQGRARKPSVRGAPHGLTACVTAAIGRVASRRAPDTGTVAATFVLELAP